MHRITSASAADLFDIAATRRIEQAAAPALPPHTLMQRAGLAAARLAMALAPHARTIWIACGPGNNGGDGFEAAAQLRHRGSFPVVTFVGDEGRLPADAKASLQRARDAGVTFASQPPSSFELAMDALLGIGSTRPPSGAMAEWLARMHTGAPPVLSLDVPSGLDADTGTLASNTDQASASVRTTLTFLTLKPGLFTAQGRDAAGTVWFDDLGCSAFAQERPTARLAGAPDIQPRTHASHKGSYGDVAVIGGASGMAGAALLAGSAALHAGAGRVFVGLLDPRAAPVDTSQPELMLRDAHALDLVGMTVVCGCGGGDAVRELLPRVLSTAATLVLDADALNAIAADPSLQTQLIARGQTGAPTVLTPHPLEAARLLGDTTGGVQANRLAAARALASRFGAVTVLKGSGTVIADAGDEPPVINSTGNARLATAGTGDVLAGMIGAALVMRRPAFEAACEAVWQHGRIADLWPADAAPLTAGSLARRAPY
ncbi:bifunctional ADP-dependent NAD(P)H-hydrate dehydratase/NAD(P)H-hydrate epimerase [Variovorax boronicumulans]|uniref:bifunctional ADP-dependent NAD(P)H-hydrate dehydratase/NAD(P)H-hydrate epimerase n=1 Tax=Variovorax boronicumulans TaxID=436515 RepID=UPI000782489A|nr:bifunctional ADP-dependent NAD(P)H-hydrate dehydratase/NAD(P)H-hydrate epimerase [Variovorax boronicumulans]